MNEVRFIATKDGDTQTSAWYPEFHSLTAQSQLTAFQLLLGDGYSYRVERRLANIVTAPTAPVTVSEGQLINSILGTVDDESLMADADGGTLSARLRGTNKMVRDVYDQPNHRFRVDGSGVTQPVSGTFWQATQPVSAASLPLPSGAATAANQATELTSLTTLINRVAGWPNMLPNSYVPVQSLVTGINLPSAGMSYLLCAVKKQAAVGNFVRVKGYEGAIKTNDFIKFALVINPTVAGSLSYSNVASTPFQHATGVVTNIVTGGREIDCTYASLNMQNYKSVENGLSQLGASDVIALVGTPALGSASVNVTAYMNVEWV